MAEIIALMHSASEGLVALNQTNMKTSRISNTLLDWTADLSTLVSLATFILIANFCAQKDRLLFLFLSGHDFIFNFIWVIHCVAWYNSGVFTTSTFLLGIVAAELTFVSMAGLFALMLAAW